MKTTLERNAAVKNGVKRMVFAGLALVLEIAGIILIFTRLNRHYELISLLTRFLGAFLVLGIYSEKKTSALKMPWIILILVMPVFGITLYFLIGLNGMTRKMRGRFSEIDRVLLPLLSEDPEAVRELEKKDLPVFNLSRYIRNYSGYPVYRNTDITYFDDAAKGLKSQKEELRKAEKFIFMEYHAIEDAESWHGISDILEKKAEAGVDVRVFYDDMGSIGFINTDFVKRLEKKGIRCRVFNAFAPGLNIFLNNRDHRKITVIDGKVGFTGGYNLANEYFNLTHPFGHWKDTGIRLKGDAVRSLTETFLEMWYSVRQDDEDAGRFLFKTDYRAEENGFIQPYADSPMDNEPVGENVYISIAENAVRYVWYVTPYLILTDEMIHAFGLAAKRGVDVRIITPGIPDKKMVYNVTRSYYNALVSNGVRIFEYTPGFCHCKMCVADDRVATNGTINLDYRSLYHHFENGCVYSNCRAVAETKEDFDATLKQCREVTEQYRTGRNAVLRFGQLVLRLFAPLM
jgi:cardiolipin synthase